MRFIITFVFLSSCLLLSDARWRSHPFFSNRRLNNIFSRERFNSPMRLSLFKNMQPRKTGWSRFKLPLYTEYRRRYGANRYRPFWPTTPRFYRRPWNSNSFSKNRYANNWNRKYDQCPWNSLPDRSTKILTQGLQEYGEKQHTVKKVISTLEQYNYFCTYMSCPPARYEVCVVFTIAPTSGCDWNEKCNCTALQNKIEKRCSARGSIVAGSNRIENFRLHCNGGIPSKTTTTTTTTTTAATTTTTTPLPTTTEPRTSTGVDFDVGIDYSGDDDNTMKSEKQDHSEKIESEEKEFDEASGAVDEFDVGVVSIKPTISTDLSSLDVKLDMEADDLF